MRPGIIFSTLAAIAILGVSIAGARKTKFTPSVTSGLAEVKTVCAAKPVSDRERIAHGYHLSLFDRPASQPQPGAPAPPSSMANPTSQVQQPAAPSPIEDLTFTGTVNVGGVESALIENIKTREGTYLRTGDSFLGGTVKDISDLQIVFRLSGRDWTIARNQTFSVVPLTNSAEPPVADDTQTDDSELSTLRFEMVIDTSPMLDNGVQVEQTAQNTVLDLDDDLTIPDETAQQVFTMTFSNGDVNGALDGLIIQYNNAAAVIDQPTDRSTEREVIGSLIGRQLDEEMLQSNRL